MRSPLWLGERDWYCSIVGLEAISLPMIPETNRMPVNSIGDAGDAALALMVVRKCEEIDGGLPSRLRMMMLINVVIDFIIGLVPFVGDIADAIYKANTRNAIILEKHLREKGAKRLKNQAQRQDLPAVENRQERIVDHSLPEEWDKHESGVIESPLPNYHEQSMSGGGSANNAHTQPTRPPRAKKTRDSRGSSRWFGGSRGREEDVERGR